MMRGDHAAMRGHNGAKRVSFAAMRVYHATMDTSNVAMEALITATYVFNAANSSPFRRNSLLTLT